MKNMLDFASSARVSYGSIAGGTAQLPKSFSINSSREIDATKGSSGMRRSYSVGVGKIGRIDKEACPFREDDNDAKTNLYPRCRGHAIRREFILDR
ncbi:hypothetical protein P3X46_024772 [Hevea brasiliensis]|uniref:Uncharacterized protein n=1 Tax=Hevea brasiliensis TaxID=3981 RepID=A0ABQ9L3J3_HEVBR|nr:hypothetical protein P3X46_024772 [Hevea brasiliensis]